MEREQQDATALVEIALEHASTISSLPDRIDIYRTCLRMHPHPDETPIGELLRATLSLHKASQDLAAAQLKFTF